MWRSPGKPCSRAVTRVNNLRPRVIHVAHLHAWILLNTWTMVSHPMVQLLLNLDRNLVIIFLRYVVNRHRYKHAGKHTPLLHFLFFYLYFFQLSVFGRWIKDVFFSLHWQIGKVINDERGPLCNFVIFINVLLHFLCPAFSKLGSSLL